MAQLVKAHVLFARRLRSEWEPPLIKTKHLSLGCLATAEGDIVNWRKETWIIRGDAQNTLINNRDLG